jgi:potassium-dependent mechanosensitive channel
VTSARHLSRLRRRAIWTTLLLLAAGGAVAQEGAVPAPDGPTPAEVAGRFRAVSDSVPIARREIERLGATEGLEADVEASRSRQRELEGLFRTLTALEHTRPERLFRLRDQALLQEQRLEALSGRASSRQAALGELRADWLSRLGRWTGWRQAAPGRPELAPQLPEIRGTIQRIDSVLTLAEGATRNVASLDRRIGELQAENADLLERIARLRAGRRAALLHAGEPVLFSAEHLASLRDPDEWRPRQALAPDALAAFGREHAGILILHLLLVFVLGVIARALRTHAAPEGAWEGMLHHPWAMAVFAGTALLARSYILAPPLWDVVTWTLLAGSAAVLAPTLLRGRTLRLMIVSVAAVYPLVLAAEALRLPTPVFRLALAAAAAAALVGFPLLARRADVSRPAGRRARLVLWVATALSAAVLIAQVLGMDQLSRWLLHGTLTSAYVVFAVVFLLVVARGGLRTLLRRDYVGRIRLVGTVALPLVERLVALLQVVLVTIAVLVLLDVWELAPAPLESWRRFVALGFEVAGLRITVGRILFAAVLVYVAALASWLVRTLVSTELSRGRQFERGVAESINALVHYSVVTLGILLALGALGVELQNFAIVAGALGVGIGFGLQNIVNNFVSGLILLFERPVRVGDTVEIGGEWGTIKKIGLRSTVVVTFTQSELIVPNGDLISEKVTNWSLSNPITRMAIPVGVAYGSDVQRVLEILRGTAGAHPAIIDDPKPVGLFTGFGDNSLDFELRIWIREIPARVEAKSAVLSEIDRRFREEGIEVPYPQRDLHLRSVDPGVVRALEGAPRMPPHD